MLELFTESLTYIFLVGQTRKLIKNGVSVTNSANLVVLVKNITLTVVDCCALPPLRLAAHCVAAGATITASIASPNSVTIDSAVHLVT